ncbi:hypothetical protein TREMEDRAFT_64951 [Tremella mesenterica DSM 1558]|uniref:uncharacterized protein n=1 Tax=Tremella mesenterica (strain ATCC 24925 / CBS 8224 / DSM 1558 / NBRC 9311 / NRRL Y-6157 / RJB 2259-6 / UBC 559-6) TaxID=578456 RepID=UPI0003F491EC|nr:uncharacterized protein TREMEDRAFT_64951 [Tremella mesenterica DSM 1558]EIW67082.1 hypothetical protein TREMEDRAFT_64951 [Tremella mesenterica DSM 1558]
MFIYPCDGLLEDQNQPCPSSSIPITGNCSSCGKHLCQLHSTVEHHPCVLLDEHRKRNAEIALHHKEISTLLDQIDSSQLESNITALKPGIPCRAMIPLPSQVLRGGMNVHISIQFEDGVRWFARIRQQSHSSPPIEVQEMIMRSEMITMQFLKQGGVRVPEVFPGNQMSHGRQPSDVGERRQQTGPFKSSRDRFISQIDLILEDIEKGLRFVDDPQTAYLVHLQVKQWIMEDVTLGVEEEEFYIKHADDKGDHIMVDDEGNITGIIDWEWAYSTTKSEAFSAPLGLVNISDYFNGSNSLSPQEERLAETYEKLGRPDLSAWVRASKKYQRLLHTIGQSPDIVMLLALGECFGQGLEEKVEKNKQVSLVEWVIEAKKRLPLSELVFISKVVPVITRDEPAVRKLLTPPVHGE